MKDSGIEWIGEIPEGWKIENSSQYLKEIKDINIDKKELNALKFSLGEIVKKENIKIDNDILDTLSKYTKVKNHDIIINGLNLEFDFITQRVGLVREYGIITSAYLSLRPHNIFPQFAVYLLKSYDDCKVFHSLGRGLRKTLTYSELKKVSLLIPPLAEQQRIADYLDAKCAHIDHCLELTRQSMEKLRAYKLSCITEAVTKGLDPDAPLKNSSLWWTPKIPQHWDIEKIGWNFSIELGKMLDSKKLLENNLYHYLRNIDIKWGEINYNNLPLMSFTDDEKQRFQLKVGDLLVCEGGDIGRCAIVHNLPDFPVFYQKAIHRVREISKNKIYYLRYILFCMSKNDYFSCTSNKSTIAHLPAETFKQLRIPLPPLPEQERIAAYLDKKCARIDALLEEKQALLDKLAEYKKSLIFECVTGKREVPSCWNR